MTKVKKKKATRRHGTSKNKKADSCGIVHEKEREKIGGRRNDGEKSIKERESRLSGLLQVYMSPKYDQCTVPLWERRRKSLALILPPFQGRQQLQNLVPLLTSLMFTLPIFITKSRTGGKAHQVRRGSRPKGTQSHPREAMMGDL